MRPGHVKLPKNAATEAVRATAFERKEGWKAIPGNRYTPEELHRMSGEFADCTIRRVQPKRRVMHIA